MREKIESLVRWLSVVLGALILGSCTVGGFGVGSDFFENPLQGLAGALLGFLSGVIGVGFLFGWVYVYFQLRRDLKDIQAEIVKLRADMPPDPGR